MWSCALLDIGLGRRVLQKLDMDAEYKGNVEAKGGDAEYEGNVEATGEDYSAKLIDVMGEIVSRQSSLRLVILVMFCFICAL